MQHQEPRTDVLIAKQEAKVEPQKGISVVELEGKKLIVRKDSEKELTVLGVACTEDASRRYAPEESLVIATALNHCPDPFKKQFALATAPNGETYILENEKECISLEKSVRSVKYLLAQAVDGEAGEFVSKLQEMAQFSGFEFYLEEREIPEKVEPKPKIVDGNQPLLLKAALRTSSCDDDRYVLADNGNELILLGKQLMKADSFPYEESAWADESRGRIGIAHQPTCVNEAYVLQTKRQHEHFAKTARNSRADYEYYIVEPCSQQEGKNVAWHILYYAQMRSNKYDYHTAKVMEFANVSMPPAPTIAMNKNQNCFFDWTSIDILGEHMQAAFTWDTKTKELEILGRVWTLNPYPDNRDAALAMDRGGVEIAYESSGSSKFTILRTMDEHSSFASERKHRNYSYCLTVPYDEKMRAEAGARIVRGTPRFSGYGLKGESSHNWQDGLQPIKGLLQGGFFDYGGSEAYLLAFDKEKKEAQVLGQYLRAGWMLGGMEHSWADSQKNEVGVARKKGSEEFFLLNGEKEHLQFNLQLLKEIPNVSREYDYYIIKCLSGGKLSSLVQRQKDGGLPDYWHNMLIGYTLLDKAPIML